MKPVKPEEREARIQEVVAGVEGLKKMPTKPNAKVTTLFRSAFIECTFFCPGLSTDDDNHHIIMKRFF
jgi:hypothetical protein